MPDNLTAWTFRTPIGWCAAIGGDAGLQFLVIGMKSDRDYETDFNDPVPEGGRAEPAWIECLRIDLDDYFAGGRPAFAVPLAMQGVSDFGQRVYAAARSIPYGEVRTYGWLAEKAGSPGAARAVGGAMATNPVPLIVPCHRVVRSDGGIGGFSARGGVDLKRKLLFLEGAPAIRT